MLGAIISNKISETAHVCRSSKVLNLIRIDAYSAFHRRYPHQPKWWMMVVGWWWEGPPTTDHQWCSFHKEEVNHQLNYYYY